MSKTYQVTLFFANQEAAQAVFSEALENSDCLLGRIYEGGEQIDTFVNIRQKDMDTRLEEYVKFLEKGGE